MPSPQWRNMKRQLRHRDKRISSLPSSLRTSCSLFTAALCRAGSHRLCLEWTRQSWAVQGRGHCPGHRALTPCPARIPPSRTLHQVPTLLVGGRWAVDSRSLTPSSPGLCRARGSDSSCSDFCWKAQERQHRNLAATHTPRNWSPRGWKHRSGLHQPRPVGFLLLLSALLSVFKVLLKHLHLENWFPAAEVSETALTENPVLSHVPPPSAAPRSSAHTLLQFQTHFWRQIPEKPSSILSTSYWWLTV